MPRFAANLSLLYTDLPFLDRFAAAKADGFEAIECQFPYEWYAQTTIKSIHEVMVKFNLPMVLHNLPAGDWANGERGIACDPNRVEEFRAGVPLAIKYAKALNVPRVNCIVGILPVGVSPELAQTTLVSNLTYAAEELKKVNIKLLIEPINTFDIPGFFLAGSNHAIETIMAVKSSNLYLQYDAYHLHRMGEDILEIEELMPFIDHIQIADHPGRREPGTGEILYSEFFMLLDELDYSGWVGCEYKQLHKANFLKD